MLNGPVIAIIAGSVFVSAFSHPVVWLCSHQPTWPPASAPISNNPTVLCVSSEIWAVLWYLKTNSCCQPKVSATLTPGVPADVPAGGCDVGALVLWWSLTSTVNETHCNFHLKKKKSQRCCSKYNVSWIPKETTSPFTMEVGSHSGGKGW